MRVGRLGEIRRYPVKSMGGELLDSVALAPRGLPGDRAWAVRDEVRGGIRGAKKLPGLMGMKARYAKEPPADGSIPAEITLPDGSTIETGHADVNARLSAALDHEVTLWPLLPADALDHYRRGRGDRDDMLKELREIFGRLPDEPLPDLGAFPPEILEFESPPGTYFDAFPLLLLTQASLDEMQERAPGSAFDVRRFRPNLLVTDTGSGTAFPEQAWHGRRLRVGGAGGAVIELTMECPRCVMTTHGFDDLPKDPGVMRALVQEAGGNLGVYGRVDTPGRLAVGDEVELLD